MEAESGQEPNTAGQEPAASNTPPVEAAGQEPAAKTYGESEVRELRNEAASWRKKVREIEGKLAAYETDKLSETEKLQKTATDALAKAQAAETALRSARAETAIANEAVKHGIPPALLTRLVDVEFDDDGNPVRVAAAVNKAIADFPHIKPGLTVSATNPNRAGSIRREDVARMSRDEIVANYDAVMAAMKQ